MWPDDWGLHMTTQKSDGQRYRAAVREAWDEGLGTLVVPAGFELSRLDADRGVLTAEIIDAAGTRFGARVTLPPPATRDGRGQDGETTPAHWALWTFLVPLMEELETDAVGRISPGTDGVRWITMERSEE